MKLDLRLHIARLLCLLMAVYLLNFSVDTRSGENSCISGSEETTIKSPETVENLLCLALNISLAIEVESEFPEKTETENETETETTDALEFFNDVSHFSLTSAQAFFQEELLHLPGPNLKTLYPEVICPPPKHFFPAVA